MGTSAYLLRKYAPASVAYRDPGSVGAKQAESTIPEIFLAPWSGQRDVCVFASQIRTRAAVAYRRPCLLAINASRLFNARTLSGSSPRHFI